MLLSRENIQDARYLLEKFIPNSYDRDILIEFLANSIIYASKIDNSNWNLNLDKRAKFIRFNVGHEYCIQIKKNEILIICMKNQLKPFFADKSRDILFQGYSNKVKINSYYLNKTPDILSKVPNSVGCLIKPKNLKKYVPIFESANREFIEYAIKNTTILPIMKHTHSLGVIKYIKSVANREIPNPIYTLSYEELKRYEEKLILKAKRLSLYELRKKALEKQELKKVNIYSKQYIRNPFVSEYAKRIAKGICQDCKKPAPFINKITGEPYLETHHIIPLAKGGSDTIDNVIALCPNCHRKRHYG